MEHLNIQINDKDLTLPNDFSISFAMKNPIFNDVEMFSYPMQIPMTGNRSITGNVDDVNSTVRPVELEHTPVRVNADGLPLLSGTAVMQDNEQLNDTLAMNIDASTQSFDDLIGDLTCREIPIKDKIVIGEKMSSVSAEITYNYHLRIDWNHGGKKGSGSQNFDFNNKTMSGSCNVQALGFSYPGICHEDGNYKAITAEGKERNYPNGHTVVVPQVKESFVNTAYGYGEKDDNRTWYYCNARVCYKHHALSADGTKTEDGNIQAKDSKYQYEDLWPYWVLDADRQQSGICFYVLYFLDCLFAYLNLSFDKSALLAIEDFKHLCFFTTHCKYTEEAYAPEHVLLNEDQINNWLSSRGCGASISVEDPEPKSVSDFYYEEGVKAPIHIVVGSDDITALKIKAEKKSSTMQAKIVKMIASPENFPDSSVKEVLDALQNAFGVRFSYDYERHSVTAYLYRDVFRNTYAPISIKGQVESMIKVSEKITGMSIKYSLEDDAKKQVENITSGKSDYETDYNYIDYPDPESGGDTATVLSMAYNEISAHKSIHGSDRHIYIDKNTGNAYRWKINKDYVDGNSDAQDPVLFEVGGYKGVEIGDCRTINKDFVVEHSIGFQPVIMNDVSYQIRQINASGEVKNESVDGKTVNITGINNDSNKMIMAAYIDEDMEHEFLEQKIRNTFGTGIVDFYLTEYLKLVESYDPSKTDDGNSPLQSYDWGLAFTLMRGGGADARIDRFDFDYDGFGNAKWRKVAADYQMNSDSMDLRGDTYDYNGTETGVGGGERFSLKIRAYKTPAWAKSPSDTCNADTNHIDQKIQTRGLYDTFLMEYAHFIVHRNRYTVKMQMTVAQLIDIKNHWKHRFRINGKVGYINEIKAEIKQSTGLQEAEIDFMTY